MALLTDLYGGYERMAHQIIVTGDTLSPSGGQVAEGAETDNMLVRELQRDLIKLASKAQFLGGGYRVLPGTP
jgi:hypothetical protein